MARARNIKPGFFKNEDLGTADPFVQLLFAGLWTLADKAGILEDRPLRIKAEIFPYREGLELNRYLTELHQFDLIHRYEVNGVRYIQVAKFKEHQNPHHTEKQSIYPSYSDSCKLTVKTPEINGDTPADSLIPDSLIPDSSHQGSDVKSVGAHKKTARTAKGFPLPADWVLPKAWGEWALDDRPEFTHDMIRREADKFRDHWHANANQRNGKKSDWFAAWRNWFRAARVDRVVTPFKTAAERRTENIDKAVAEFLGESKPDQETVIEGEFSHA
jgi:hypothetical protein